MGVDLKQDEAEMKHSEHDMPEADRRAPQL